MIDERDELLHERGDDEHWQESFYFNWFDTANEVFGVARIGFRFNQGQVDGLVFTIRGGRPEFAYPAVNLRQTGPWEEQDPVSGMRAAGMRVTMEEPLERWRVELSGRNSMDLAFESLGPPFDFKADGREIAPAMTGEHFEQTCRVTGWTRFKGRRLEVDGLGQRDKSWGVRSWPTVEGWNWISGQFGPDLSFNATQTFDGGARYDNGFVFRDGANYAVEKLEVDLEWGSRAHLTKGARIEIADSSGEKLGITARAIGQLPMVKSGAWLQETSTEFFLDGRDEPGYGVIEHVWRPSVLETVARIPELATTAFWVLKP